MGKMSRRDLMRAGIMGGMATLAAARGRGGGIEAAGEAAGASGDSGKGPAGRLVTIEARPYPVRFDTTKTAAIVVDMQNDFGSKGGMFDLAGIDIAGIQRAIEPTAQVLAAARDADIRIVYLKMGYRPDLSDLGAPDSVNRARHLKLNVGKTVRSPQGSDSRILIRDTWNTDIVTPLTPRPGDLVLYKTRFSGFYNTDLDTRLKQWGIRHLLVTGCTTSICVDSTVRDAMFRDYLCVLLADCMSEPIGDTLARSNHEATLLTTEVLLGWVSSSAAFLKAVADGKPGQA
jgi:ureidoacrylate peracid hydrolase